MSLISQCTIRSCVLNRECPSIRPVLQCGHGVAAARQGTGRATRISSSDGSPGVAGWRKRCSKFMILAVSPFLLPDQHADRRPPVHRHQPSRCKDRVGGGDWLFEGDRESAARVAVMPCRERATGLSRASLRSTPMIAEAQLASMTPNFPAPACMQSSAVAALALRPSGAYQRHQSPIHPPGPRRGRAHRRSLGWAVGLVSPASFCIQGVVGALAQGFGLFTSDFGVGTSQDLDC